MSCFSTTRLARIVAAFAIGFALSACGKGSNYPYSRDSFMRMVEGRTLDEVVAKLGPPAQRNDDNPNAPSLTYHKQTFDGADQSKDETTTLVFKRDPATGQLRIDEVLF